MEDLYRKAYDELVKLIEIGKTDLSNPKYRPYWEGCKQAIANIKSYNQKYITCKSCGYIHPVSTDQENCCRCGTIL